MTYVPDQLLMAAVFAVVILNFVALLVSVWADR